jgi:hypothetical protein
MNRLQAASKLGYAKGVLKGIKAVHGKDLNKETNEAIDKALDGLEEINLYELLPIQTPRPHEER